MGLGGGGGLYSRCLSPPAGTRGLARICVPCGGVRSSRMQAEAARHLNVQASVFSFFRLNVIPSWVGHLGHSFVSVTRVANHLYCHGQQGNIFGTCVLSLLVYDFHKDPLLQKARYINSTFFSIQSDITYSGMFTLNSLNYRTPKELRILRFRTDLVFLFHFTSKGAGV